MIENFLFAAMRGILCGREIEMVDEIRSNNVSESGPIPLARAFGHPVQKFRFIPESYLAAAGAHWDTGLDQLVYLRSFIEDETDDRVSIETH